jgi:hypothetical protein
MDAINLCLRRPGTFSRKGSRTSKSFWLKFFFIVLSLPSRSFAFLSGFQKQAVDFGPGKILQNKKQTYIMCSLKICIPCSLLKMRSN